MRKRGIVFGIILSPILIISIISCAVEGIEKGISYLFGTIVLCMIAGAVTRTSVNKQIKDIKKDKLYVTEAIYEGTNKYGTGFFQVARSRNRYSQQAMLCEPDIKIGDKVILVKKGQVWVYKARK